MRFTAKDKSFELNIFTCQVLFLLISFVYAEIFAFLRVLCYQGGMSSEDYIQRKIRQKRDEIVRLQSELSLLEQCRRALSIAQGDISEELFKKKQSRAKNLTFLRAVQVLGGRGSASSECLVREIIHYSDQTANLKTIRSHLHRLKNEARLCFDKTSGLWSLPK